MEGNLEQKIRSWRMYNSHLQISKIGAQKHEQNNGMSKHTSRSGRFKERPFGTTESQNSKGPWWPQRKWSTQRKCPISELRSTAANRPLLDSDPATEGTAVGDRTCDGRLCNSVILIWRGHNQAYTILPGWIFSIATALSCHTINSNLRNFRIPHHREFSGKRKGSLDFIN